MFEGLQELTVALREPRNGQPASMQIPVPATQDRDHLVNDLGRVDEVAGHQPVAP